MIDIDKVLENLSKRRTVFFSEADLQMELAMQLKSEYSDAEVVCEFPTYLDKYGRCVRIDILIIKDSKWIPIELKYKTKKNTFEIFKQEYTLKNHYARDVNSFQYLKDIERIEAIREEKLDKFCEGYTIFITNSVSYTTPPPFGSIYEDFSLENSQPNKIKYIKNHMEWRGEERGWKRANGGNSIDLLGKYSCHWKNFSNVKDINGNDVVFFRLVNKIERKKADEEK